MAFFVFDVKILFILPVKWFEVIRIILSAIQNSAPDKPFSHPRHWQGHAPVSYTHLFNSIAGCSGVIPVEQPFFFVLPYPF